MQRLASVLIAILALGVFAAAGYLIFNKDPVPRAGQVLPLSTASSAGDPSSTSPSSGTTGSGKGQVVAFLGDDWTLGVGASSKSKRFTTIVSKDLGLVQHNFGADGTGYAKSTDSAGNYASQVDAIAKINPAAVVVSGGLNDRSDSSSTVASDAKSLFAELHRKLPKATLIAIEPMFGDSDKPASIDDIAAAVRRGVMAAGGMYLPIDDPIHNHPSWMSSNEIDPNDTGYAAIAKAIKGPLRNALAG